METPSTQLRMLQVANQPGPFYCFLRPLIFELMRQGVEVDVACNRRDSRYPKLAQAGMHMVPLEVGPWGKTATWKTLKRQLAEAMARKRYDICVVHTPAISWITRREAARARIPVVAYTAHGLPFFERQGWLTRAALRTVEKLCARYTDLLLLVNSDDAAVAERLRLVRRGGLIRHIPGPGVDAARWQAAPSAETMAALRREFGMRAGTRSVLYLGRLMDTKGVLDLVEVLARLDRQGSSVELIVAGTGPLDGAMRRLAAERGVAERLHLLGWRDDVIALMHLGDVLVLPSTYREGLPTVLMEAGAAGKPVIAYRNRGASDIIVDGQTGYLTPAGDVPALTAAVERVLDDANLARRLGAAGRERIASTFSFAQGVRAQLDAYADILERKGFDASSLRRPLGEPIFCLDSSCDSGAEDRP